MQDLDEHPFSPASVARESGAPNSDERAWLKWVADVEEILEIETLDGDQGRDGYSLDFAHDEFRNGLTPEEYAGEVKARRVDIQSTVLGKP